MIFAGALAVWGNPAAGAPACIENHTDESLFLVVDDLQGQRVSRMTAAGGVLCLDVDEGAARILVGVFAGADALEGCSRLSRPGQTERVVKFSESDNCAWMPTRRGFSSQ